MTVSPSVPMNVGFVIPVLNQVDYTKQCLESLNRAGVRDCDIFVVNNASTDGTADFLSTRPQLRVVTNATNLGCAGAWNQGVEASTSEWIMILNNDVIVAPGFCEGLVGFANEFHCDIVSPGRGEGALDYDFQSFASAYRDKMASACRYGVAMGSSFMVHRRVFDGIGLFDPKVGLAGNEDMDFFRRAHAAGFRLAITGRAYLHHFSSVTQKSLKAELGLRPRTRLYDPSYFRKKHGLNWFRRHGELMVKKARAILWRWQEKRRYGFALKMWREAGEWHCE